MKLAMSTAMATGVSFAKHILFVYYLWKTIKIAATILVLVLAFLVIRRIIRKSGIVIGRIINDDTSERVSKFGRRGKRS